MKVLLFVLLFFTTFPVRADQPRWVSEFKSPNGDYIFRIKSITPGEKRWEIIEKDTNKILYQINGDFGELTVLVSDDGKQIAGIDDYSSRSPDENPVVLWFYADGEEIKTYKLSQVLDDIRNVGRSVSHFFWISSPSRLAISDAKLELTTFEQNRFVFDFKTGEILKKEKQTPPKK